jgi:hypothetical protein
MSTFLSHRRPVLGDAVAAPAAVSPRPAFLSRCAPVLRAHPVVRSNLPCELFNFP